MRIILIFLTMLVAGCATIPTDPNIAAINTARATATAACATSEDVSGCMLGVVATFATGDRYQRPASALEQWTGVARVLVPGIVSAGQTFANIEHSRDQRDVEIARMTTMERMFASQAELGAAPNYVIGGNLGDTYGNDYTGGDRTETTVGGNLGDTETTTTTTNAGRDLIGGDRIDLRESVIGDGNDTRYESPGPIDSHDCTPGTFGCGVTNPEPEPEAPEDAP